MELEIILMLKKVNRLQRDRDFMKVFKIAKPVNTENFSIRTLYRNTPQTLNLKTQTRIGIVISNKIDKRATKRNELKRKIRAIFQEILPELKDNVDIIVQVKKAPEYPYDYQNIKEQIKSVLTKR